MSLSVSGFDLHRNDLSFDRDFLHPLKKTINLLKSVRVDLLSILPWETEERKVEVKKNKVEERKDRNGNGGDMKSLT